MGLKLNYGVSEVLRCKWGPGRLNVTLESVNAVLERVSGVLEGYVGSWKG